MAKERCCDYCHREIEPDETAYELKLEMFASPEFPDDFGADTEKDHTAEIEALLEIMESMDVEEATDEVYECYLFRLCPQCRRDIHARLKNHQDKKQIF